LSAFSGVFFSFPFAASTYSGAGDNELDLAAVRTHQDAEVVYDAL
jgi:hypothetical protein